MECTNGTLLLTMFKIYSFFCTLLNLVSSVMFFVHTHTKYDRHTGAQGRLRVGVQPRIDPYATGLRPAVFRAAAHHEFERPGPPYWQRTPRGWHMVHKSTVGDRRLAPQVSFIRFPWLYRPSVPRARVTLPYHRRARPGGRQLRLRVNSDPASWARSESGPTRLPRVSDRDHRPLSISRPARRPQSHHRVRPGPIPTQARASAMGASSSALVNKAAISVKDEQLRLGQG